MVARIGIFSLGGWEGGRLYAENLARSLLALPAGERPEVHWLAVHGAAVHPEIERGACVARFDIASRHGGIRDRARVCAEQVRLRAYLIARRIDFVMPAHLRTAGWPAVGAWIPDLQHLHYPELWREEDKRSLERTYGLMAQRADVIVLSSETVARDFRRFLPAHADKVRILRFATPLGEADLVETDESRHFLAGLPARFACVANQFWKHKDHPTVFRALAQLSREGIRIPLVCTGKLDDFRNPGWADQLRALIHELAIQDQVILAGLIPRAVQLHVLHRAAFIVQPSLFEGWSTVVEDARALGRPIVVSRIPTHVEQDPPRARFFEPGDVGEVARAMRELWLDDACDTAPVDALRAAAVVRVREVARRLLDIARDARRRR
jgi:glycosyltransferase involved in cell wall biosynthesis